LSEQKEIGFKELFAVVLRESENESLKELDSNFYVLFSEYIGKLKKEEYDNVDAKIKNALVKMATELLSLLLKIRLEKATTSKTFSRSSLLDEEKFILDKEEEMQENKEVILSAIINAKPKLLESLSKSHKEKPVVVRFVKEMDEIVGVDLEKYGPFKTEDVATIPHENAQALISKNIAIKVRIEDT